MSELLLSAAAARVISALVEKSITTPAYYPMTVNGLMLAANQKSARHPVMALTEGEVGAALNELEGLNLVSRYTFSVRAQKWRHQFLHQLLLQPQTQAVLVTLMLRGPQTLAELRAHAENLGGPRDPEAMTRALQDLADRAYPLLVQLPRAPGQSAVRYAHTLCGAPATAETYTAEAAVAAGANTPGTGTATTPSTVSSLLARIEALEARVAALEGGAPAAD